MKIVPRWLVSLAILVLALVLLAPVAYAQAPFPQSFYGTLKINGADAPTGTAVTAKFGAVDCGSYTTTEVGKYGDQATSSYLLVACDGLHSGDTISFYVNGVNTYQTASFVSGGGPTELNLTADIIPTSVGGTVVPVNKLELITPWLIVVALMAVAGVWLGIWNRRRITVSLSDR